MVEELQKNYKRIFYEILPCKGYSFNQTSWDLVMLGNYIQYLLIHEEQEDYDIALMVDALKIFIMDAYPENEFKWMRYDQCFIE